MSIENNLQLISYLAAAETYNQGKSIYECFLPIVESVLIHYIDKSKISLVKLQNEINENYHLNVPKSTLKSALQILHQQKKIKILDYRKILPHKNELNSSFWENRSDRENAIEDFFLEFNSFLVKNKIDIPLLQLKEDCCNWLYYNTLELATFASKGNLPNKIHSSVENDWGISEYLVDFLLDNQQRKTEYFRTFLLLYNGAVQSSLFNFDKKEIDSLYESSIPFSHIILDSNFILRILDIQSEFDCAIALETLNILKENGSQFYILKQTLEEIQRSIKNYLFESEPYTIYTGNYFRNSRIRLTGFWEATRRGVSRDNLLKLANKTELKERISKLIEVNYVEDFDDTKISENQIMSLIESKKRDSYGEPQARHDLSLIAYCKEKRNDNIDIISKIDWWILTNDERLTYWNQQNTNQYQECLTEIQLSNLIWIQQKRVDNSGLMQTIVSLSSSMAISSTGIENLVRKIHIYQEENNKKNINLDKLSLIFANNMLTTADILKINAEEDAFDQVLEEKILEIQNSQCKQQQEYESIKKQGIKLSDKNDILLKQVNSLTVQLELVKCRHEIEKYERDICDAVKVRDSYENKLEIYNDLHNYQNEHELSTSRYVALLSIPAILPIVVITIMYIRLLRPYLLCILEKINSTSSFTQDIICTWIIPLVSVPIYYWAIAMLFGNPLSPKELFYFYKHKLLKFRTKRYMKNNNIPLSYQLNNIEQIIRELNSNIDNVNRSIKGLNDNISEINTQISSLQSK